jgi:hypothetical protein
MLSSMMAFKVCTHSPTSTINAKSDQFITGICMGPLTRGLGWSRDQVELYLPGVRRDLNDMSVHTYYSLHVITAQKPYS